MILLYLRLCHREYGSNKTNGYTGEFVEYFVVISVQSILIVSVVADGIVLALKIFLKF